jgi:N-methylhydantoinase B/oxoprolinase/acetone carboxylase alpha subunit
MINKNLTEQIKFLKLFINGNLNCKKIISATANNQIREGLGGDEKFKIESIKMIIDESVKSQIKEIKNQNFSIDIIESIINESAKNQINIKS